MSQTRRHHPWPSALGIALVWAAGVAVAEMGLIVVLEVLFHSNVTYYVMAAVVLLPLLVVPALAGRHHHSVRVRLLVLLFLLAGLPLVGITARLAYFTIGGGP